MSVSDVLERARAAARPLCTGTVTGAMGLTISVDGVTAAVGDIVEIGSGGPDPGDGLLRAEVVGTGTEGEELRFAVASFATVADGLLVELTEVWADVDQQAPPGARPEA